MGGVETQALEFIKGLQSRGHQCTVIAQKNDPNMHEDEIYQNIPIKRFDFNAIFHQKNLKILGLIENYLKKINAAFQPNIVHLNICIGWPAYVFLMFKEIFKAPLIVTVHAPYFYKQEENPLIAKIASQADRICCVSHWVLKTTQNLIPSHKEKCKLIYNGLSRPNILPSPLPFSPPALLLAGRFTEEKGFDTAIEAFSLIKNPRPKLWIAGDGKLRKALEMQVKTLHLENRVHFTGSLQKTKVLELMNQTTVVIIPSYFESFGLIALEAMQMGRPVIASSVGGLPEIIRGGETGLLVKPSDPKILSQAIQSLLDSPETAIQMGRMGAQRVEKMFTIEQNTDAYEYQYRELVV